ncbi:MAG TPA: MBL fold metallo-hydrolase [Candidatus Marinimicrobia bacterium]|nr:MBL fold metallo-hydrolase [Candidatus Neomarinimicrobiota bacterium]
MQLTVLGTAAQMPTARRNHNAYFLKWEKSGFLIDPGEGVQRQMIYAGIRPSAVTHILISHFHGDHCFGLPGLLQKLAAAKPKIKIPLLYPADGEKIFRHLLGAAALQSEEFLQAVPINQEPFRLQAGSLQIEAQFLNHRVPALGYRINKAAVWHICPKKIAAAGLTGSLIGKLKLTGKLDYNGKSFHLADYAVLGKPIAFAAILDTRPCDAAERLLQNAHLALLECTYLPEEQALAENYKHLTVSEARALCENNHVNNSVLTHFSQRYDTLESFEKILKDSLCNFILADDLDRISIQEKTGELFLQKAERK